MWAMKPIKRPYENHLGHYTRYHIILAHIWPTCVKYGRVRIFPSTVDQYSSHMGSKNPSSTHMSPTWKMSAHNAPHAPGYYHSSPIFTCLTGKPTMRQRRQLFPWRQAAGVRRWSTEKIHQKYTANDSVWNLLCFVTFRPLDLPGFLPRNAC